MRRIEVRRGVVRYEKEHSDLVQEAVITLAQRAAMALEDDEAAKVGALFPQWMPGTAYKTGSAFPTRRATCTGWCRTTRLRPTGLWTRLRLSTPHWA